VQKEEYAWANEAFVDYLDAEEKNQTRYKFRRIDHTGGGK
jgi:hypothetical protein